MTDFCRVESNEYDQIQCWGCRNVGALIAQSRREPNSTRVYFGSVVFHNSYQELAKCATRSRCVACQVFQRALLLSQITLEETVHLRDSHKAVYASVSKSGGDIAIDISLGEKGLDSYTTIIGTSNHELLTNTQGVSKGADWTQLRSWLAGCDKKHACRSYRWSNANPSWLIKILPRDQIQLVRGPGASAPGKLLVPYVALSYCWGNEQTITEKDPKGWARVQSAHTKVVTKDKPVAQRLRPFSRQEYPETIRDAIKIVEKLGLEYLWVDSVCIPEQAEWDIEATKMHEVYGNAYLTLSACAADKAIDPLLSTREAWNRPIQPCRFYGFWLAIRDRTLTEIREDNPLASRGWILQEERLSPRVLYWCSQRAYWSCCERHATEARQSKSDSPERDNRQDFILQTREGATDELHKTWLMLVSSYARCTLAEQGKVKDRFKAISGLAVRYLSAANQKDEYLGGLWRADFARHLAWTVSPRQPHESLRHVAPSWSWASVPMNSVVHFVLPLSEEPGPHYEWVESPSFSLVQPSQVHVGMTDRETVAQGATIKEVSVRGRMRRLIASADSIMVPWEAIEQNSALLDPGQPVHARRSNDSPSDGDELVVCEAHKAKVLAKLDYWVPPDSREKAEENRYSFVVGWNEERELWCLEVGKAAMLLLKRTGDDENRFCRVGVGIGFRWSFFNGHDVKEIVLE